MRRYTTPKIIVKFAYTSKGAADVRGRRWRKKLSAKNLLRRLHVKKKDKIYQGVDAFIELWSEIPRFRFLAFLLKKPVIYQLSWCLYELFALFLFYKNKNQLNKIEKL